MTGPRYACRVDIDAIQALDFHTHVEIDTHGHCSLDDELMAASAAYFKSGADRTPAIDAIAEHYREHNMAAVVFTIDATTATGREPNSIDEIAERACAHSDVLIPFGSVDPLQGAAAVERAKRLIDDYGVRGFKFHPSIQAFAPNDRQFYPLYEVLASAGVPALFHTGQTGIGSGLPGGHGIKLRYSDPMLLDDVAADFPTLTVVMAHPAVPWVDAQISIATHKANVFVDLSGWSPRYFPPQLVRALNTTLRTKALFGSDYPVLTAQRWLRDFTQLEIKPEIVPLILRDNAIRLLNLQPLKEV